MTSQTSNLRPVCLCHQWISSLSHTNTYYTLCKCTVVNEELLQALVAFKLIPESLVESLGEQSDFRKSKQLYKYLWSREGINLLDKLLQALHKSGNLDALTILQTCPGKPQDYGRVLYMSKAIMENYQELCDATSVNEEMLSTFFENEDLSQEELDLVNAEITDFSRSKKLYDLLSRNTYSLLWSLLYSLKFSGNEQALEILNEWAPVADAKEKARYVKTFEVVGKLSEVLAEDGATGLFDNLKRLKLALETKNSDFVTWEHGLKTMQMSAFECLENMLRNWSSRNGNLATIKSLRKSMNENGLEKGADELEGFNQDAILR